MRELAGRVAVVTGGGGGIGRATGLELAAAGCDVAVVDVSTEAAEATARAVRAAGRRASVHAVDVRDPDAVDALARAVVAEHGGCHVLVNNAGVTYAGRFEDESLDDLRWIVDVNVWGVVHGCRAFLPVLRRADEAHIVNMSSMVGLLGFPYNVSYSLTKGAVRAFGEGLRAELRGTGIGLTTVHPGAIRTGIIDAGRGDLAHRLADMNSRFRLAPLAQRPPEVVARAIVRAIRKDRPRVVVGPDAHLVGAVARVLPGRSGAIGRAARRFVD